MGSTADIGGTDGWGGATRTDRDEPVFAEPWEGRAFAMTVLTMGRISGRNLDAFRHALGRLHRGRLPGGRLLRPLAERGRVDAVPTARSSRRARSTPGRGSTGGSTVAEPPVPGAAPSRTTRRPPAGSLRQVDAPRGSPSATGCAPRTSDPAGHTRLPGYVRGRTGVVTMIQPAARAAGHPRRTSRARTPSTSTRWLRLAGAVGSPEPSGSRCTSTCSTTTWRPAR